MLRHGAHQVNRSAFSGSKRAVHVDEAAAEDPLDQRALLGQLADAARLALLGMHVDVGARDVQVAAEHERPCRRRASSAANASSASRKRILAGKSLPPFGT